MDTCNVHGCELVTWRRGRKSNGEARYRKVCRRCESARVKAVDASGSKRAWDRRNVTKRRAHKAVEYALMRGDLVRQPCERCGGLPSQAHHEDYEKPLDVMWLCPPCHGQRHREIAAERAA